MSKLQRIGPALVITLVALAVRLQNLTYHSIWFDEAMSVHWARSSVARIFEVSMNLVEDRLPPLYYLSMHYWRLLVGDGEVAVRLPSVLLGTLLIPILYRLATDLFDRRVGILAAALTALNPFLVWYSQEARMYAQAVFLAALGTWFFFQCVRSPVHYAPGRAVSRAPACGYSAGYWFGYGLCTLAGPYTHLYTSFVLMAHALYLLLTWRRSRRAWLPYAVTMLAVALLFVPLGLAAWRASSEAGPGDPFSGFWARAWRLLGAFTVWKAPLSPGLRATVSAATAGFAAAGLLLPPRCHHPAVRPRLLLVLLLLTPPAVATLLLFRNQVALLGERYFIVSLPWLLIAIAAGSVNLVDRLRAIPVSSRYGSLILRHVVPVACYLLPVVLAWLPLPGQWSPPARKEAWRETIGLLAMYARPEDAILIHPDWTRYPLQYYFRGPGHTYAVFGSVGASTDLDTPLRAISNSHPVIWLVESHTELADPEHRVNAWLTTRFPLVTELYPPGLDAVRAYAPGYISDDMPDPATPTEVTFAGGVKLAGYSIPQTRLRATDDLFHPPSGWLHVTLYFGADRPLAEDYTPFVHLVDNLGQVWGASLERPGDAFDHYPPPLWEAGQVVRADFDVNLNPLTPPGRYTLVVGMLGASGTQIPVIDGSLQASLTTVEIVE